MTPRQKIKEALNESLSKFKYDEIDNSLLFVMSVYMSSTLNNVLKDNEVYTTDFPIEWENDLGKFYLESNGMCEFFPKIYTKNIQVSIKITNDVN